MPEKTSLKRTRKWILFILGFIVILLSFLFSKKIIESSPPPRKKAENKVRDVYTKTVKNSQYQVEIPSDGILRAYKRIQITSRVQGILKTIKPLFKYVVQSNLVFRNIS